MSIKSTGSASARRTSRAAVLSPIARRLGAFVPLLLSAALLMLGLPRLAGTAATLSSQPQIEALQAGYLDIGVVGDGPPVFAQAAEMPIVYFACEAGAPEAEAIIVPRESSVTSIRQLAGKRVLVMGSQPPKKGNEGQMAYFTPDPKDPSAKWIMHPISEPSTPGKVENGKEVPGTRKEIPGTQKFSHGLGIGDLAHHIDIMHPAVDDRRRGLHQRLMNLPSRAIRLLVQVQTEDIRPAKRPRFGNQGLPAWMVAQDIAHDQLLTIGLGAIHHAAGIGHRRRQRPARTNPAAREEFEARNRESVRLLGVESEQGRANKRVKGHPMGV